MKYVVYKRTARINRPTHQIIGGPFPCSLFCGITTCTSLKLVPRSHSTAIELRRTVRLMYRENVGDFIHTDSLTCKIMFVIKIKMQVS